MDLGLARFSLLGMVSGLIVWSVYFAAVYAFLSIGCALELDRARILGLDAVRFTLGLMTLVALGVIGYLAGRGLRRWPGEADIGPESPPAGFVSYMGALLAALAFVATVWVGLPIVLLPPCT